MKNKITLLSIIAAVFILGIGLVLANSQDTKYTTLKDLNNQEAFIEAQMMENSDEWKVRDIQKQQALAEMTILENANDELRNQLKDIAKEKESVGLTMTMS